MTTPRDTIPWGDTCDCGCLAPALRRPSRSLLLADRAGLKPFLWV